MVALVRRRLLNIVGIGVASAILNSLPAFAADLAPHAPFGLSWGMTSDDVRKMGVTLTPVPPNENFGICFAATNLPKVIGDAQSIVLDFGYDNHLFKVVAIGELNRNDPYAFKTQNRYQDLVSGLSAHYGAGNSTDIRDTEIWKTPDEYVMSLKQGRAFRYTTFLKDGTEVEISIRAQDGDSSFWSMIFKSISGSQDFEKAKKTKEKDSL